MIELWNNLTVSDEDPGFLYEYNFVISDVSITNGEDNSESDGDEQEDSYVNMELGLPFRSGC